MKQTTPGPWRVERQNASPTTGEWMIAGSKPGYLAEVRDCGSGDPSANACLIAAAPELLSMLERFLDEYLSCDPVGEVALLTIEQAQAAIKKAKGEI